MSCTAGLEAQAREGTRLALQLLARLLQMVEIKVRIAQRQDEIGGFQAGNLRHHKRKQRIRRDIERHAEEQVGASLIHLARKPPVGDVKLEKQMAGR